MVTHDRYFLERVVTGIAELTRGKLLFYEANYSHYLELKAQAAEMAEASERKRQAVLRREYQWVIRGCQARTTKSKERLARYDALKGQQGPQADGSVQMAAMILHAEHSPLLSEQRLIAFRVASVEQNEWFHRQFLKRYLRLFRQRVTFRQDRQHGAASFPGTDRRSAGK